MLCLNAVHHDVTKTKQKFKLGVKHDSVSESKRTTEPCSVLQRLKCLVERESVCVCVEEK